MKERQHGYMLRRCRKDLDLIAEIWAQGAD